MEIRRRKKKLNQITKRKKLDEEDEFLLTELQQRKTNQELQEEIKKLKDLMNSSNISKKEIEVPPKPQRSQSIAIEKQEDLPPVIQRRIKSHLPSSMQMFFKR